MPRAHAPRSWRSSVSRRRRSAAASGAAAWRSRTWCACSSCPTRCSRCSRRVSCPRATAALCCRRRDHNARRRIAREARERSLSVRQTEALARGTAAERPARAAQGAPAQRRRDRRGPREPRRRSRRRSGAEVRVRLGRRGGTVEIPFEELSEVLEMARRIGAPPGRLSVIGPSLESAPSRTARAISSVGQSASLIRRRSLVRVQDRPSPGTCITVRVSCCHGHMRVPNVPLPRGASAR